MQRSAIEASGAVLDALGIRWVVFGALAANLYRADTRTTADLDLLLLDAGPGVEAIESAFRAGGWTTRRGTPAGEMLRARHPQLGAVDLVIAETEYQRTAIARARVERLAGGREVRVLSAEDVVIHKLIAGRTQDIADIENILDADPALDEAYLERWADAWEVVATWQRLRDAARARRRDARRS